MSQSISLLLRLILNECSVLYPEVLSSTTSKLNCIRYGLVPERLKHDLLSKVYAKFRGGAVLKLGLAIRQSGYSPILNILFESTDPSSVLKKWCRVEEKCDIRLRIDYTEVNNRKGFLVKHVALSGPRPTKAEGLFICGTQISIFEAVGCQNVRCYLVTKGQENSLLYANGKVLDHLFSCTDFSSQWRIEWDSFIKNENEHSNLSPLRDYDDPAEIIASIISILSQDISRNWKLGEVSSRIGMSRRSLQRYLNCLDTRFSLLKTAVRIHCASGLLSSSTLSITQIGYECGFSDTSHFSRSFHQSSGLPPSNYRKISQGVELSPTQ